MPRPLPVGLAGRIHRLDRLVPAYHPPQFLPRARVALSNRGHTTVVDFLQRARSADMSWPLPEDMTDAALEAQLFPASTALAEIKARRPQPDWRTIHRELRRKGVTLQLLWEEHRAARPNGYGYSR